MDDSRLPYMYPAVVVDNQDPRVLGRVRVKIPGLLAQSGWAMPASTVGGGSKERGFYAVPENDADVFVMFLMGDPDRPVYFGGNWGTGEIQSYLSGMSKADAPKVRVIETKNFLLVFDDRSGNEQLILKEKGSSFLIRLAASKVELGGASLVVATDGVVLAQCPDPFTGATHGALGGASSVVLAKKT